MRWKLTCTTIFAALCLAAVPAHSQVNPSASRTQASLAAGGGISYFSLDYGFSRKMIGINAWIDYTLPGMPHYLHGLGIEAEGRDINYDRPSSLKPMRQDTLLGGPIYSWQHFHRFQPYAKYLMGIGSIDFPPIGTYSHDTRTVFAPGVGFDYQFTEHIKARADYEYQFWHAIFGPNDLTPQGVTFGVLYTFGGRSPY